MSARLSPRRVLIALAAIIAASVMSAAHAGLFRAFLSSSGNDANLCTVQQPCRLLPAALNTVNDGGEIWMLDSANYNTSTVNITKSVSILAVPGAVGSVVANGSDAIEINAPTSNVSLRNVNVRPLMSGGGVNGITIASVGHLSIDNSVLENLTVGVSLTGAATISINDSVFRSNTFGLQVNQSGGAAESLSIDHVNFIDNAEAILGLTDSTSGFLRVTIDNSVIRGGGGSNGALAFGGGVAGAAPVNVSIAHTKLAGNGTGIGVSSFGVLTVVSIADCHISGWSNGGTRILNGQSGVGAMQSLGNNFLVDNGSGQITGTVTPQ